MTPPSQADLDLQRRLAALTPEQRRLLELRRRQKEATDPSRPRPLPRRPREPLPLSFGQERLWFLDRMDPGTAAYNIPAHLRLAGDLDVPALKAALQEVVRRHEALRTTFAEGAGGPVQVIAPELELRVPVVDLRGLPAARGEGEMARWSAVEAATAVRPRPRAAAAHAPAAADRPRVERRVQLPPHRRRRLVDRGADPRDRGPLSGPARGAALAAAGAAAPVRGLRRLAAGLPPGPGSRRAARLLAAAAPGRAGAVAAPHRPAAAGGAALPRRQRAAGAAAGAGSGPAPPLPGRGRHPVHGGGGGLLRPAGAAVRRGRPDGGHPRRGAQAGRAGRSDRAVHQLPRAAPAAARRSRPARAAGRGARHRAWRLRPPGPAVRQAGGGAGAGAQPQPDAAVPDPARAGRGRLPGAAPARADPGAGRPGGEHLEARPHPAGARPVPGDGADLAVQHRPLRRRDRAPAGRPLRHAARRRRGRSGPRPLLAAADGRRRGASGGRRVE